MAFGPQMIDKSIPSKGKGNGYRVAFVTKSVLTMVLSVGNGVKDTAATWLADLVEAPSVAEKVEVAAVVVYMCMCTLCFLAMWPSDRVQKLKKCGIAFVLVCMVEVVDHHHATAFEQPWASLAAYALGLMFMCQVVLLPGLFRACQLVLGVLLMPFRQTQKPPQLDRTDILRELKELNDHVAMLAHNRITVTDLLQKLVALQSAGNQLTAQLLEETRAMRASAAASAAAVLPIPGTN